MAEFRKDDIAAIKGAPFCFGLFSLG